MNGVNQMSNCYISNQIAEYCDQDEGCCPECGCTLTEKYVVGAHWLECDNEQCGHTIDLDDFDI